VHPSALSVGALFTSKFLAYSPLPIAVTFSITVTGAAISSATTTVLVNVSDYTITSGYPNYIPTLITQTSLSVSPGQTNYFFNVTSKNLTCYDVACDGLPQHEYGVQAYVDVVSGVNQNHSSLQQTFFIITQPLQAALVSPAAGASVSTGNVTFSVAYIGSYIAGVNLNIYTSTGSQVFSHNFIEFTPGIPQNATWIAGQPGVYSWSIVVTTVYLPATHYVNGTVTVITHGGNVYYNETKWTNQTVIPGISGAAGGTLLLVVGLIVGMIVALVLARAVMGKPAQAPPQPWESKPGAAATPNTCSVCGKSFGTPEELAAHGKSEHGMQ